MVSKIKAKQIVRDENAITEKETFLLEITFENWGELKQAMLDKRL